MKYQFGRYEIDTDNYLISVGGEELPVEPQVFGVLACLVENHDRVVSKDNLINEVWGGRIVSDTTITSRINKARKAVGDDGQKQAVIKTFPRRGFRFVANLNGAIETARSITAPHTPETRSIAVLPFANLSEDPEQEFFSDGLTEDIITALSRIRSFFVIARNSTFVYKGKLRDIRGVANDLGVRYVVEGSVRRAGDQIRVTAQLVDASTNSNLWTERFDRNFAQIFSVQDEITQAVVAQLEPELSRAEFERAKLVAPENLDAWELFHRGMHFVYRLTSEGTSEARRLFEQAIERDPNFAPAHAGIVFSYLRDQFQVANSPDLASVINIGLRAVELDDKDPFSHFALGAAYVVDRQTDNAIREIEESLQINPNYAQAHEMLGYALFASGKAHEAIPHIELAIRLSPSDTFIGLFYQRLSRANLFVEQDERAVEYARKAIQKNAPWPAEATLVAALSYLGRLDEAIEARQAMEKSQPGITLEFVQERVATAHQPYVERLLDGLRMAGLPER